VDFDDYTVTRQFFEAVCKDMACLPQIDVFADNINAKVNMFFSLTHCPGTLGVDAFNYNWANYGCLWIFVPPRMILRTLDYMQRCRANGLILVPQWKTNHFYPALLRLQKSRYCMAKSVYNGQGIFIQGMDAGSYFGPAYRGNVELWHLDFN